MKTNKTLSIAIIVLSTLVLLMLSSCQPKGPKQRVHSATEKHYELKGKVIAIDKAQRTITVAHEDIKDYMPAMTMPFNVKDDWVFEIATPGNRIGANLIVDGTQSWLEEVVLTEDTASAPGTTPVEGAGPEPGADNDFDKRFLVTILVQGLGLMKQ